jgi:hypothetical protein
VIAAWGKTHPAGLVFIDTLAIWAGIEDENDAGQGAGLALLVHPGGLDSTD